MVRDGELEGEVVRGGGRELRWGGGSGIEPDEDASGFGWGGGAWLGFAGDEEGVFFDFPAILEPEGVVGAAEDGAFEGGHGICGGDGVLEELEGEGPVGGAGGGDGGGDDFGAGSAAEEGSEWGAGGEAAEEGEEVAGLAGALVAEDGEDAGLAEERGEFVEAEFFREEFGAEAFAGLADVEVDDGVIEWAVVSAARDVWGDEACELGQEFPVAHVGEEEDDP